MAHSDSSKLDWPSTGTQWASMGAEWASTGAERASTGRIVVDEKERDTGGGR
jgi:hypothetical protein